METTIIASGVTIGAAFGVIGGMSIRYRLFERRGATPASVLTPIPDDWYRAMAARLMALPKDEAEAHLSAMGPGVAATVRSYIHCPVCNEAA
jgi:hypothetical protein